MMPVKYPSAAGKPYVPSNGTEGDMFMSRWCHRCIKESGCTILTGSMFGASPKQWRYDGNGEPECTSFRDHRRETNYRCRKTEDLF